MPYITKAYKDYIKSVKWQRKRKEYFATYGYKCQACKTTRGPIHVHHMDYKHLGNEPLTDLMGLCYGCHKDVTTFYRRNRRYGLRRITMEYVNNKGKSKTR